MFLVQLFFRAGRKKAPSQLLALFMKLGVLYHASSGTVGCLVNWADRKICKLVDRGMVRYLTPSAV